MKTAIPIGIPTHFRTSDKNVSACGVVHPERAAFDGRDVDCLRCRKTKVYRVQCGPVGSVTAEQLKNEILCACNAITDSVLCSGNDPATTLHFVRKLRAVATG